MDYILDMKLLTLFLITVMLSACGGGASSGGDDDNRNTYQATTYVLQLNNLQCNEFFANSETEQNNLISAGAYPGICTTENTLGSCSLYSQEYSAQIKVVYYPDDQGLITGEALQQACNSAGGSFESGTVVLPDPVEKTYVIQNSDLACTEQTTALAVRQSLIESSGGVEGSCSRSNALGVCVTGLSSEDLVVKTIYYPDSAGLRKVEDLVEGCEHIGGSFIYGTDISEPTPEPNPDPEPVINMDVDKDGFADFIEVEYGTDPVDALSTPVTLLSNEVDFSDDNDSDGFSDHIEAWFYSDPNHPASKPIDVNQDFVPDGYDSSVDADAPRLIGFDIAQDDLTIEDGLSYLTFNLTVIDDQSGIESLGIYMRSHNGHSVFSSLHTNDLNGNVHALSVPSSNFSQYAESGEWLIDYVVIYDNEGNSVNYNSADLQKHGFSYKTQIENLNPDLLAPTLDSFSFSDSEINIETGRESIVFNIEVSDDLSGLDSIGVYLRSPGGQSVWSSLYDQDLGGRNHILSMRASEFGLDAEDGIWEIDYIVLYDEAGNSNTLSATVLEQNGYPSTIVVNNQTSSN